MWKSTRIRKGARKGVSQLSPAGSLISGELMDPGTALWKLSCLEVKELAFCIATAVSYCLRLLLLV